MAESKMSMEDMDSAQRNVAACQKALEAFHSIAPTQLMLELEQAVDRHEARMFHLAEPVRKRETVNTNLTDETIDIIRQMVSRTNKPKSTIIEELILAGLVATSSRSEGTLGKTIE